MNYKVEDLVLYKEREDALDYQKKPYYIYNMEKNFSEKEKVNFIDKYWVEKGHKGMATYMLNLIDKFNKEKDAMPKDQYGGVKTVSVKAWLKRNDTFSIVNDGYHCGNYYFIGREYLDFSSKTPISLWGSIPYGNKEGKIVDQWFHDVLNNLYKEEVAWYKEHDVLHQKVKQIVDYCDAYGNLGIKLFDLIGCNGYEVLDDEWLRTWGYVKPTEEQIDKILEAYKEVDAIMQVKIKEIQERLGWVLQKED